LLALSVNVRVAVREPVAVGVKLTLTTQVDVGMTLAPFVHVVPLATAKSPAFAPVIVGAAVKFRLPFPLLVTVTVPGVALVVPTG
jgi:hypothetical protein